MKTYPGTEVEAACILCISLIFISGFIVWGCTLQSTKKEVWVEEMTDVQLLEYYHALGERIRDIDMRQRIDKELNRSHFEHDILQDQAIDWKIYRLEQRRKMVLKELRKRNIAP